MDSFLLLCFELEQNVEIFFCSSWTVLNIKHRPAFLFPQVVKKIFLIRFQIFTKIEIWHFWIWKFTFFKLEFHLIFADWGKYFWDREKLYFEQMEKNINSSILNTCAKQKTKSILNTEKRRYFLINHYILFIIKKWPP